MKLYNYPMAPNARRVRIYLAEKGIEVPMVEVDLRSGEHMGDEFFAKNRNCTVPVLELDDGTCIAESMAVCRYFEATHPEPPLFGKTPTEKALVEMWSRRMELDGLMSVAEMFRNLAKGLKGHAVPGRIGYEQIPELVERGRKRSEHFLSELNRRLDQCPYVAGDDYSVADITAMVSVDFAKAMKLEIKDSYTSLTRWHDEVSSRPSASA